MSINNIPPTQFFDGINYNPSFFSNNSGISLAYGTINYLSRIGAASSLAITTTFSGIVNINNGLNVTGGETVDTLNATTSLSVGGFNINTIYATISSLSEYVTNSSLATTLSQYVTNLSYDSVNNSTNIISNSWFEATSIDKNCNIGSSLNVDTVLSQNLLTNTIKTNDLSCKKIILNEIVFNDIICFIYLNNISFPLQKSNLISNFNISPISFYFTLKNNYRIDIADSSNNVLYSYTNITSDYIYYQQILYNSNMIKINLYNCLNVII